MPKPKKDRTEEIQAVFEGLQYCNIATLLEVIQKANKLIYKKRDAEIASKKKQLEDLQAEIAELEKQQEPIIVDEEGKEIVQNENGE